MKSYKTVLFPAIAIIIVLSSCHPHTQNKASTNEVANMHFAYDDSTLTHRVLPVMMPYNRLIEPAGRVISFGDPNLENHSLDVKLIPHSTIVVVEERYGITLIDTASQKVVANWAYKNDKTLNGLLSTYSGLLVWNTGTEIQIFWSASGGNGRSVVIQAKWDGQNITILDHLAFAPVAPSPLALPNELAINTENGKDYLYIVLNGNNQLVKVDLSTKAIVWTKATGVAPYGIAIVDNKIFVTNWGGLQPTDDTTTKETAGVPYGRAYIDHKTGATAGGTVLVFNRADGSTIKEIAVGLHPNVIIADKDGDFVYTANANSDNVSAIYVSSLRVTETIPVRLSTGSKGYIGDSPNALALANDNKTLYVANGMDNAVAVVRLGASASHSGIGKSAVTGFIPTEAYPGGLLLSGNDLFVTNLEGEGSRISSKEYSSDKTLAGINAYNSHHEKATVSIIAVPDSATLKKYTDKVQQLNITFRETIAGLAPRNNVAPKPMPERIGEPSVFKHVVYIIKENRTYDQILGDMTEGNGSPALCIYGDSVTPNQHQLARKFLLLDNYYASGKCSAEGHQWTDAAMVTDYVEKNVRAWFRSYPHVQEDALVYDMNGFIWNNAADHGKSVRIYGEASSPHYDPKLSWTNIYNDYKNGKQFQFYNTSTISRVTPMLSKNYPAFDGLEITDQIRASAFINELKDYEKQAGDALPNLMVVALPDDHTTGTRPGYPKPQSMVADNDLALGRIIEALNQSRFWKNTVVFVTEDDSQDGWDHVSAYRTTGFVISAYSCLQSTVKTNYNQTSVVRSIEQILGIPPMNALDATALPMFNCFSDRASDYTFSVIPNKTPLDDMNKGFSELTGKSLLYARASSQHQFDHVDGGNDDLMNRILWHAAKGKKVYPGKLAGKDDDN